MRRWFAVLGALNLLLFALHAGLSWVQAGAAGYAERPFGQVVFYNALGERVAEIAGRVAPGLLAGATSTTADPRRVSNPEYVPPERADQLRTAKRHLAYSIGGDLIGPTFFIEAYLVPLVLVTLITLGAVIMVARTPLGSDPRTPVTVLRWATAFVVVMGLAMPVLVPDFWLSFAWGRTLWWGGNPYYNVPAAAVQGLPFDAPILKMTYGPLWAAIAWAVAAMTRGSVLWGTVVFKVLLSAAWVALLHVTYRLTSDRAPRERAIAMLMLGWLPLGAVQVGGDGHNDVFMLLGIMGWLYLRQRGRARLGTLALALSVAIKYVSAPLFLLDVLATTVPGVPRPTLLQQVRAYLPRGFLAAAIWVICFAPFVRSPSFFAETTAVREGYFFLPADAVKAFGTMLGVSLRPLALLVMGIFPLVTMATVWAYWRSRTTALLYQAVAGIMLSVLFVAAGHVWPWYVLWLAAPAALLASESRLGRWSTGVLLTAPFPLLYWTAYPHSTEFRRYQLPSLAAYGLALVWMAVAWRVLRPAGAPAGAADRGLGVTSVSAAT